MVILNCTIDLSYKMWEYNAYIVWIVNINCKNISVYIAVILHQTFAFNRKFLFWVGIVHFSVISEKFSCYSYLLNVDVSAYIKMAVLEKIFGIFCCCFIWNNKLLRFQNLFIFYFYDYHNRCYGPFNKLEIMSQKPELGVGSQEKCKTCFCWWFF